MALNIYTYSNPYEINKEPYWDSIKNCAHFCVSQTMVNGLQSTYSDFREGKLSTVEKLVNELYSNWTDNVERYIEQYSLVDSVIRNQTDLPQNVKNSLLFDKKNIVESIRLLMELDMSIKKIEIGKLSEEQKYVIGIYNKIIKSDSENCFFLSKRKSKEQIKHAIHKVLLGSNHNNVLECDLFVNAVVFHGIHQFSPMILCAIEEVSKYVDVILLFNYQRQYKNIYQTWIDVYSAFDMPIKSQFDCEFRPSMLLPVSYKSNLLADKIALLEEGKYSAEKFGDNEIIEFDNITEFSDYVANVYDKAKDEYLIRANNEDLEYKKSVLFYMQEQFYAANGAVNDILKIYYPEQFGERHFLAFPIGHFFIAIADMWNVEEGGIQIENVKSLAECLNSGIISEEIAGELLTTFNLTKIYFEKEETIIGIIDKLENLLRSIKRTVRKKKSLQADAGIDELLRLNYFNVDIDDVEKLIKALNELDVIAKIFYQNFEDDSNFKDFYQRVKEFIENKIIDIKQLDDEFKDVVSRLLMKLNNVENIKTNGTFECLKETMYIYLSQQKENEDHAKWIVRDFEQIDGDILKSDKQSEDTIYHFCCLSDNNMNVGEDDKFPWPLDVNFFEVACEPYDWKYQVFVKAMKEFKNFKKYALVYGLQFNRVNYKLSYIRTEEDKQNEMFYPLRILGFNKKVNRPREFHGKTCKKKFAFDVVKTNVNYSEIDYYRYKLCPYRFILETYIEGGTKYKEKFLVLKYLEVLLELTVCEDLNGIRYSQVDMMNSLNDNYERISERFKFAMHIDKADIITNAMNFIMQRVTDDGKFPIFDAEYVRKKKEFIHLSITKDGNEKQNILIDKLYGATESKIRNTLNDINLSGMDFERNVDDWCKDCANREVCLEYYCIVGE